MRTRGNPGDVDFAKFLVLLDDNPHKKIFVHCRGSVDRSGVTMASYRLAEQGCTAAEALVEMKAYGFSAFTYEQRFPSVRGSSRAFSTLRRAE